MLRQDLQHLFSRDRNLWEYQLQRGRRASGERFRPACAKPLRRRQGGTAKRSTPGTPRPIKTSFSFTTKVSLKRLMIRNSKDFGVWSACPSGVHSVITVFEMLPTTS